MAGFFAYWNLSRSPDGRGVQFAMTCLGCDGIPRFLTFDGTASGGGIKKHQQMSGAVGQGTDVSPDWVRGRRFERMVGP